MLRAPAIGPMSPSWAKTCLKGCQRASKVDERCCLHIALRHGAGDDLIEPCDDLADKETFDALNVGLEVWILAPIVVPGVRQVSLSDILTAVYQPDYKRARRCISLPLPIASSEHLVRLVHGHALAGIVGITRQLVSITKPALEVILKMIERSRPGLLILRRPGQGCEEGRRGLEVLLPECGALIGGLELSAGRAGPGGVESIDVAGLLVDGDRAADCGVSV